MLLGFAPLERGKVEWLRLAALLALDQRVADALHLEATLLLTPDEVADHLAVVGVVAGVEWGALGSRLHGSTAWG